MTISLISDRGFLDMRRAQRLTSWMDDGEIADVRELGIAE